MASRFGCSDAFTLAARMRDRRDRWRRRAARTVEVAHGGRASPARCRDLSETGMKVDLSAPLALNDEVTVALSPTIVLCGTVAWVNGRQCGIAFDCPVDIEALLEAAEEAPSEPSLATLDLLGDRQQSAPSAPLPRGKKQAQRGFQPGLTVTVMAGTREERAVVHWAKENIAALEIEAIEEALRAQKLLPELR